MFKAGQLVSTRYGNGTVICVGSNRPHVYVRVHSRSDAIYLFDDTDIAVAEEAAGGELQGPDNPDAGARL